MPSTGAGELSDEPPLGFSQWEICEGIVSHLSHLSHRPVGRLHPRLPFWTAGRVLRPETAAKGVWPLRENPPPWFSTTTYPSSSKSPASVAYGGRGAGEAGR